MRAGHGDGKVRVGVRRQVQARVAHLEPVGLHGDRSVALEQRHDGGERLVHALALRHRLDAHHVRVGDERARPAAQHGAAARHVVELHEALGHHEGMVVGQAGDAGAEHDVAGALGRRRDGQLGRGDQLPAGGMVLADPGLVVAQVIEPLDQLHVAARWPGWGSRPPDGTGRGRCRTSVRDGSWSPRASCPTVYGAPSGSTRTTPALGGSTAREERAGRPPTSSAAWSSGRRARRAGRGTAHEGAHRCRGVSPLVRGFYAEPRSRRRP